MELCCVARVRPQGSRGSEANRTPSAHGLLSGVSRSLWYPHTPMRLTLGTPWRWGPDRRPTSFWSGARIWTLWEELGIVVAVVSRHTSSLYRGRPTPPCLDLNHDGLVIRIVAGLCSSLVANYRPPRSSRLPHTHTDYEYSINLLLYSWRLLNGYFFWLAHFS